MYLAISTYLEIYHQSKISNIFCGILTYGGRDRIVLRIDYLDTINFNVSNISTNVTVSLPVGQKMLRQMSSQHAVTDAKGTLSEWTRLISLPLAF